MRLLEVVTAPRPEHTVVAVGGRDNSKSSAPPPLARGEGAGRRFPRAGLNWHFVRLANKDIKLMLVYDDDPRIVYVEFEETPVEPQPGDSTKAAEANKTAQEEPP